MLLLTVLAAVAINTSAGGLAFDPEGLDLKTLRTVAERGTAVIVDADGKGALKLVTAGIVIDATPQAVYDVATDFAHYPEFMPQVQTSKVVDTKPDHTDVDIGLKFHFSVISTSVAYTQRVTTSPPDKVDFKFVGGELKVGGGSWRLVPLDGGKKTLAFYSTISDLRAMGYFTRTLLKEQPSMETAIQVSTASLVAGAVKKRAEAQGAKTK